MHETDPSKLIVTFTASQWYCMPEAMQRMAEVIHSEDMPVTWQLSFATAQEEKAILDRYHEQYGDEIVMIHGDESIEDWRSLLPWARLTVVGGARPSPGALADFENEGIKGIWGYCDQQVGPDGITHSGCPWGLFYISPKTTFIPSDKPGTIVGTPWTLRDLHKCYHLGQAINFCFDTIEQIRSRTLCWGENVTFFEDTIDELVHNLPWNERMYLCFHDETDEPYIPSGQDCSPWGITREESEAMYEIWRQTVRYARRQGARAMTLPEAIEDYMTQAGGKTLPSTILTSDKHHGAVRCYTHPLPEGVKTGEFGPAGHFPDTLFHCDDECQLVFVHPEMRPRTVLDYTAQHEVAGNKPYPAEQVQPTILDWRTERKGDTRSYTYRIQSWYPLPYGIAEWGDFRGWEVVETNGLWAKLVDDRVMLVRMNIETKGGTSHEVNEEASKGYEFWVNLKRRPR